MAPAFKGTFVLRSVYCSDQRPSEAWMSAHDVVTFDGEISSAIMLAALGPNSDRDCVYLLTSSQLAGLQAEMMSPR